MRVEELRAELEQLIEPATRVDRSALVEVERRATRGRRIDRWRIAGVLTAVVVVGLALSWTVNEPSRDALQVVGIPSTVITSTPSATAATPPTPTRDGEVLLLALPTPPVGLPLIEAMGPDPGPTGRSGSDDTDRVQRWVRFDASGRHPIEAFDVQWRVPDSGRLADFDGDETTVRGHPGRVNAERGSVVWVEPAGRLVLLSSNELDMTQLLEIAESLVARADGGFDLPDPPAGFELAGEWPGMTEAGTDRRSLIYGDGTRGVGIFMLDHSQQTPEMRLDGNNELVDVRGTEAVLGPDRFGIPGGAFGEDTLFLLDSEQMVQWVEGDTLVSMVSRRMTADELLALANQLEIVDEATWEGLRTDLD